LSPVVHVEPFRQPPALDGGAQHFLPGAGGLLGTPPGVKQQAGVIVHQDEEVGALAAGDTRVRHERAYQHVADPQLVGSVGREATIDPRCPSQHRALEAATLKVLTNRALGHPDAVARQQNGADLRSGAGGELLAQTGGFFEQLGMAAHGPDVRPRLGPEPVQALLAVGAHPAVQRAPGIDAGVAVRLQMTLPSELADEVATCGGAEPRVRRIGDDPVPSEGDGFGGIGAHGRLLQERCPHRTRSRPAR